MARLDHSTEKTKTVHFGRRLPTPRSFLSRQRFRGPAIALGVGLALTFFVFLLATKREARRNRSQFEREAMQLVRPVAQGLRLPLEFLYTLPAFFESSAKVTREEFRTFVEGALERHPALFAVQWVPLVKHSERELLEERARSDGISGYEIRDLVTDTGSFVPAPSRPEYLPILYMEPRRPALGLDLLSSPQRQGLLPPRDERRAFVSNLFRTRSNSHSDYLVAIAHSVFRLERPEGEPTFAGFVAVVFRAYTLLEDVVARSPDRAHIVLVDDSAPAGEQIVFASSGEAKAAVEGSDFVWESEIRIADRVWGLRIAPATPPTTGVFSAAVLGAGIALSVLLATGLIFASTIRRLRSQAEAATRLGQYTLETKIGQGGMGEVWRARHAFLRRPTAVKIVRDEVLDARSLERFEREVRATSSLTHPNTVAVYDYGRTDEGMFYYAMEFLPGLTFAELVDRYGPQPPSRVIHLLLQACGALHEAHSRGIIHRDIKPANLMLCERGAVYDVVKVVDFGLAKFLLSTDVAKTGKNVILGTPLYMPPEALSSSGEVGPQGDLYSLGAVGYYLLVGAPPFSGANLVEISMKVLSSRPERPSARLGAEVSDDLEDVILSCFEPQLERRPASARQLARALESCRDAGQWTQEQAERWQEEHGGHARS